MHYSQLLTLQHSTKLLFVICFFLSRSKLIFKVLTTTWGVPPDHILTNLIMNWFSDSNANRKWGNPQFYGQWTVEDSQNWLCTKSSTRQRSLSACIPGLSTLKAQGSLRPKTWNASKDSVYVTCFARSPFPTLSAHGLVFRPRIRTRRGIRCRTASAIGQSSRKLESTQLCTSG